MFIAQIFIVGALGLNYYEDRAWLVGDIGRNAEEGEKEGGMSCSSPKEDDDAE